MRIHTHLLRLAVFFLPSFFASTLGSAAVMERKVMLLPMTRTEVPRLIGALMTVTMTTGCKGVACYSGIAVGLLRDGLICDGGGVDG